MKEKLLFNTTLLAVSGLICRLIGFFYRIFLSQAIGAEGLGNYQLIVPLYQLCYAVSTAGIETALSRSVASALAKKDEKTAVFSFLSALVLSFSIALILSILLSTHAELLALNLLKDSQCTPLLKLSAYTLPFGALHGCVIGWFIGKKKAQIPAFMQLLEELLRFSASWFCYLYLIRHGKIPTAQIAITGLLFSEIFSVLLSLFFLVAEKDASLSQKATSHMLRHMKALTADALPLTLNKIALHLLHSAESILIPLSLIKYGMTQTEALKTLGTISGMVLPLVLFPTALIYPLSSVLLPAISEQYAVKNHKFLRQLVQKALFFTLLTGTVFMIFFVLAGNLLSQFLYKDPVAGSYTVSLSIICPFLFCDIILACIMNGLGKTFLCFLINLSNMILRLCCVCFLVPHTGIRGYLSVLIGGELLCALISFFVIYKLIFQKQPIDK